MGRLLGFTVGFRSKIRLEIWDWMTGKKMTVCMGRFLHYRRIFIILCDQVLDMEDEDDSAWEFLSSTSVVVVRRRRILEVYQIRIETPGLLPVHTASLGMPRPNLDDPRSTLRITASPRVSQCIDHGNLSDCSPFPSPSFPLAEDNHYLSIYWDVFRIPDSAKRLWVQLHDPLSSLRHASMYGDALPIPWETWSKGFYFFQNGPGAVYKISGGRLICFDSFKLNLGGHVSLFDLNRSRVGRLIRASADPPTDYARSHAIRSDLWPGEIGMEPPHPAHLASRSLSLDGSTSFPRMDCDDEHIVFWGVRYLFVPHCSIILLIFLNPSWNVL
jgi:hypothetical protein